MTKHSNQDLCKLFVKGVANSKDESHTGNLWISADGKRLMNYATCLAERNSELGMHIINRTSYSVTTSKIQGYLMSAYWQVFGGEWLSENTIYVESVPFATSYLLQYANAKIEWAKGLRDVKLINYFDVWGNKKDGWEINNLCVDGEFELHEDATNEDIFKKLKDVGFIKSRARITSVIFHDLNDMGVELYQKKDQKPICRIEFVGGRY